MTDFTPEFGDVAPGYEAAGGPLFLGLDPLLLVLLLALILIAGAVGWTLGRAGRREDDPDEVAKAIHARILAASKAALSVDSDRLVEKSRALATLVNELLGDAVRLGGGIDGPLKEIEGALEGKPAKPAAPAAAPAQVPLIAVTVNPPAPPPPAPAPDQKAQLAVAVRKFHDHWSRASLRRAELKNARLRLSTKPPEPAHGPHGKAGHADGEHDEDHDHEPGHGHGEGHGDAAADNRPIWERMGKKARKG